MKNSNLKKRSWHPIEFALIKHVARYGVTTATALSSLEFKGVKDAKQASDRLVALTRRGDLIQHRVSSKETCYSLSPAAIAQLNVLGVHFAAEVRSIESLTRAYALLSVCCLQQASRKLLNNSEVSALFPDLRPGRQQASYYLSRAAAQIQLGFVRIDRGGRGRWDRIARKTCDDMRKHLSIRSMQALIGRRQFEICVVTALPSKAQKIDELLSEQQPLLKVPYRVISIPHLINFIRPLPD